MTIDYTKPYMTPQGPGTQPPPQRTSGCLKGAVIGCGILLLAGAVFFAGVTVFVFKAIKNNSVYREAVRRAQSNPQVIAVLGAPIETGWWVTGSVNIHNESGHAEIKIPLNGSKANGTLYADAVREDRNWRYTRLVVKGPGPPIDLLK